MKKLSRQEEELLMKICQKHDVDKDHLRVLLLTKQEYSYKSSSQDKACQAEIIKNIQIWAK
jgi:hypothetical protein